MNSPAASSVSLPAPAPVLVKAKSAYATWFAIVPGIPKLYRYTLGAKVEDAFLELLEMIFISLYLPPDRKVDKLRFAIAKLDSVKFFVQLAWENRCMSNEKYALLGAALDEVGRMLGGWKKGVETKLKQ